MWGMLLACIICNKNFDVGTVRIVFFLVALILLKKGFYLMVNIYLTLDIPFFAVILLWTLLVSGDHALYLPQSLTTGLEHLQGYEQESSET
jgi:hypothetical protein